jgi:hypothetical protein
MVKCWLEIAGSGSEPGKAELGSVGQGSVGERGRGLRGVRCFIVPYFGSH